MPSAAPPRLRALTTSRWTRLAFRLAAVAVVVVGAVYAFLAFVSIRTNVLWYDSVHVHDVYGTILGAQVLLFVVFGGVTALAVAASLVLVIRNRPPMRPDPRRTWRRRFRRFEHVFRRWLVAVVSLYLGMRVGGRASHRWQTYVLWRHAEPWHQSDPQFHRDVSYYVAVLPFHRMVVTYLSSIVVTCLLVTIVASYLYGAWRLRPRGPGRRITPAFTRQVSVLLGLFLLLKACAFWLNRYRLTTSNRGPVTGMSYTDIHAAVPALTVLVVVAVLCAVLLFANARLARVRYAALGVVALYAASYVIGGIVPGLVYRFHESPSAATLDLTTITRNQAATLKAFGLDHALRTQAYGGSGTGPKATAATAQRTAQIRLLDPNQLTPTFNNKQEVEAYYGFKSTLDIDHYPLGGREQDVAIAVRELTLAGIPRGTWVNRHLVYTHGYGVVAAPTDKMSGTPDFINGGIPPHNAIPVAQPRIYFGQSSPSYSIVGEPSGSAKNIEFDYPGSGNGGQGAHTTYTGNGGVPIGSRFDRLMYAVELHDPNIFFSGDINGSSQLLTVRNPRARVAKVAPWLTLDGDVYPAVVDGQVDWVVDGYTSSASYPDSQEVNLRNATTSSLTKTGSSVVQPNTSVNYLHNSVKAVVNAYTGQVSLYEWNQANQPDPLLRSWESAFPHLVQPESAIPAALLPHLRYPQDLFDVQRLLLSHYHVNDAGAFYNGSAFWRVPNDPTFALGRKASATLPSVYMSLAPTGQGSQVYSLSTPMVTLNNRTLAAFVSVSATPGPDYGKFTVLQFPDGADLESPAQIQNEIESDTTIAHSLTLQRGGNSNVVLGNLLTIPLDGKVLYVEPVYTQAQGGNSYPILRHVIAVYGNGQPAFKSTLKAALAQAIANDATAG